MAGVNRGWPLILQQLLDPRAPLQSERCGSLGMTKRMREASPVPSLQDGRRSQLLNFVRARMRGRRLTARNSDGEPRARADPARDGNLTVNWSDQVLDDRQPEPGPTQLAAPRLVNAVESLENPGQLLARNSDPGVGYLDTDGVGSEGTDDAHTPTFGRILDCVVNQVVEDLSNRLFVGEHECLPVKIPRLEREHQAFGLRTSFVPFETRLKYRDEAEGPVFKKLLAGVEAGEAEHVQDQLIQAIDLFVDSFEESAVDRFVSECPVEQCLSIRLDGRKGRLQLV